MLTKLFVRSYFQQNELLIYFFSFLWHKISSHIKYVHICRLQFKIRWNARRRLFIHPHWYFILDTGLILYIYCMLVREIWKFIHPRVYFLNPHAINVLLYRMKPIKHIHIKYYWQTYFKSIGALSQTFKNHIHNNKEIQDQYPRENTGESCVKFGKDPIYRTKVIMWKRPCCQNFYL